MIEPTAPLPRRSRTTRALAALAALGLVSGGVALALRGGGTPEPLPLLAGNGRQSEAATLSMGAPAGADAAKDTPAAMPTPWGGIDIRLQGDLPDLASRATAWDVVTPDLDGAGVARLARALGLDGEPVRREGGWVLESAEENFSVWPSEPGWSVNLFRHAAASPGKPPADAERRARDLLDRMGVLGGDWKVDTQETEIGVGWACATSTGVAVDGAPPPDAAVSSDPAMPSRKPIIPADRPVTSCPPPPPPTKGVSVSFAPVLDGRRADWGTWNVMVGPGGAIQSVSGTWARFERHGDYDLRPVSAALDELRSGGAGGIRPMMATDLRAVAPVEPDVAVAPCPLPPDPVAVEAVKDVDAAEARKLAYPVLFDCPPPKPTVVTVTDVELGLLPAPGWDGQRTRLYLVPAYRFTGHFEDGSRYEAPVMALAPDAIAPPPPQADEPMTKPMPMPMPMPAPAPQPAR
jgi:hypothetical protein